LAASGPQGQLGARVAVDDGVVAAEHEDRLAGVLQQLLEQPHRAVRGADRLGLLLGCQPARAHRQASAGPGARSAPVPRAHGTAVATKAVTGPGYGGAGRAAAEIATTQASAPRGRPARGQAAAARAPRARPYPRCAAPTTRPARASMRGGLRASPPVAWAAGPASAPGRWRAVELGLDRVEARRDELRDVQDLGRAMRLGALARAEHDLAERAAGGDDLGPRRDGLGEALLGDTPVAGLLLLPELRAAGAAAEGVVAALLHLDQVRAAAGEDRARRVVLAVVPAEVAGVVECHLPRLGQGRRPALGRDGLGQVRVMHDLGVAAGLRVVVHQGVEAGRAGREHELALARVEVLADERRVERRDVLGGELVVEVLVAGAPGGVAGAALGLPEHGVVHLGVLEDAHHGLRRALGRRVVGAGAADEEQHLEPRVLLDGGHAQPLGPLHALVGGDAPRVAGALHAPEG